jgi:hypothetical protein
LGDSKWLWLSMATMYENLCGNCVGRIELTFIWQFIVAQFENCQINVQWYKILNHPICGYIGAFTSNNGPNNVPMQPNKHISQTSRYQLIFLFFNESKTAFIKTISSCRYMTSTKPKMYLCTKTIQEGTSGRCLCSVSDKRNPS